MNREQLATLATELTDARYSALLAQQDYEAIAALLNVRDPIANPIAQPTVDKRISLEDFVKALKPAEVVTVYQNGALVQAYAASLEADDRKLTRQYWRGLKTLVSPETVTAIEALQAATQPDPAWQPTILGPSRASVLGLPRVTPADVQAVDNV